MSRKRLKNKRKAVKKIPEKGGMKRQATGPARQKYNPIIDGITAAPRAKITDPEFWD